MTQNGEIITIQLNEQYEDITVDLGKGPITEATHNLYDNPPPGKLKGTVDLGKIYIYELPDGTLMRCRHRWCIIK
jgi:hypothetical protein